MRKQRYPLRSAKSLLSRSVAEYMAFQLFMTRGTQASSMVFSCCSILAWIFFLPALTSGFSNSLWPRLKSSPSVAYPIISVSHVVSQSLMSSDESGKAWPAMTLSACS